MNIRLVLEDYSRRLLPVIEWEPTPDGNVRVFNDTGNFYRFFDATLHAEFLYACVRKTIEEDLPRETEFLARYDRFRASIGAIADMPDRTSICSSGFCGRMGAPVKAGARERVCANDGCGSLRRRRGL